MEVSHLIGGFLFMSIIICGIYANFLMKKERGLHIMNNPPKPPRPTHIKESGKYTHDYLAGIFYDVEKQTDFEARKKSDNYDLVNKVINKIEAENLKLEIKEIHHECYNTLTCVCNNNDIEVFFFNDVVKYFDNIYGLFDLNGIDQNNEEVRKFILSVSGNLNWFIVCRMEIKENISQVLDYKQTKRLNKIIQLKKQKQKEISDEITKQNINKFLS